MNPNKPLSYWKDEKNVCLELEEILNKKDEIIKRLRNEGYIAFEEHLLSEEALMRLGYSSMIDAIKQHHGGYRQLRKKIGIEKKISDFPAINFDINGEACEFEKSLIQDVNVVNNQINIKIDYTDWIDDAKAWLKWLAFCDGNYSDFRLHGDNYAFNVDLSSYSLEDRAIPEIVFASFYNDIDNVFWGTDPNFNGIDPEGLENRSLEVKDFGLRLGLLFKQIDVDKRIGQLTIEVNEKNYKETINPYPKEEFIKDYVEHLRNAMEENND